MKKKKSETTEKIKLIVVIFPNTTNRERVKKCQVLYSSLFIKYIIAYFNLKKLMCYEIIQYFTCMYHCYMVFFACMPEKEEMKEIPQHIQPIIATGDLDFSNGQKVYVPAYSQIHSVYSSNEESRINFAVTLSIRNTDIDNPIFIKSVSYDDDDGTLLKEYVEAPFQISKMASVSFNISQSILRSSDFGLFKIDSIKFMV